MAQPNRKRTDKKINSFDKVSVFRPWNHIPAYIIIGVLFLVFANRPEHGAKVITLTALVLLVSIWTDRRRQLFSRNKRKAKELKSYSSLAASALHSETKERKSEPDHNVNQVINLTIPTSEKINAAPKDHQCPEPELLATEFPVTTISGITFPMATNLSPKQINTYSKNKLLWIRDYPDRVDQWETLRNHSILLKDGVVEGAESSGVWVYDIVPEKHAADGSKYDGQSYLKGSLDASEIPPHSESTLQLLANELTTDDELNELLDAIESPARPWESYTTPEQINAWLNTLEDSGDFLSQIEDAYDANEISIGCRWAFAAVLSEHRSKGWSFLLDYNINNELSRLYSGNLGQKEFAIRFLSQVKEVFAYATGLSIISEIDNSELLIEFCDNGYACEMPSIIVTASNSTRWEIEFETGDDFLVLLHYCDALSTKDEYRNSSSSSIEQRRSLLGSNADCSDPQPLKQSAKPDQLQEVGARLAGEELLKKVKECANLRKSDMVIACGYSKKGLDGKVKPAFAPFYEALLEAKGIQLD